jgi:formamidopyrimidine-DNA glycosylase
VPELPDITVYIEALEKRILGQTLQRVQIIGPFLLRTAVPPIASVEGKKVVQLRSLGKRIAIGLEADLWLVLHLMISPPMTVILSEVVASEASDNAVEGPRKCLTPTAAMQGALPVSIQSPARTPRYRHFAADDCHPERSCRSRSERQRSRRTP